MPILNRKPVAAPSHFSEFIRNAPAREKKKVYEQVLKRSSERQRRVLEKNKPEG